MQAPKINFANRLKKHEKKTHSKRHQKQGAITDSTEKAGSDPDKNTSQTSLKTIVKEQAEPLRIISGDTAPIFEVEVNRPKHGKLAAIEEANSFSWLTESETSVEGRMMGDSEEILRSIYDYTTTLEAKFQDIRDKDFARLDEQECIYLDYTGSMLAPQQLVDEHARLLREKILGNPHSENAPSLLSTKLDNEARSAVLEFFHADPSEYEVIWTANASAALRIVGEGYPFSPTGAFLYGPDCHNSVLGISVFATQKKAQTGGFRMLPGSLSYDWSDFVKQIDQMAAKASDAKLLGFPGESNASGLKHDVESYVNYAHQKGFDVLVDAAALAPASAIDVEACGKPDFMTCSFYKIFGYPTGAGCLIAKRSALQQLQKPWFAGGTVRLVGVSSKTVVPLEYDSTRHEHYEDGTINFQATGAILSGIRYMQGIGMDNVAKHVQFLAALTEKKLLKLTWSNGSPLVFIPPTAKEDGERGHALSVVFLTPSGKLLPHKIVESELSAKGIAVRTGCFCNPGSSLQLLQEHLDTDGISIDLFVNKYLPFLKSKGRLHEMVAKNRNQGYVRVSFGIPTNVADIETLLSCIEQDILSAPQEMEKRAEEFMETCEIPHSLC